MSNNILLFLALFFYSISNGFAQEQTTNQQYEIGGIDVSGNIDSDARAIIARSGLEVGNRIQIPGNQIPKALKAIWQMKLFTDVQIHHTKKKDNIVFLQIEVAEFFRLSKFNFTGIKKTHKDDLVTMLNPVLIKGGIITESDQQKAIEKIRSFYIDKGYLDTKINLRQIPDGHHLINLVFEVNTSNKVKIQDINFVGNNQLSDKQLRKLLVNTKLKKRLFASSKFIPQLFEEDKQAIIDHYNSLGYQDAKIIRDSIFRNKGGDLNIQIDIEEGIIYYIGNINWRGNSIYPTAALEKILGIKNGDIYNRALLKSRLQFSIDGRDISSLYMDNGYLFFQIDAVETAIRKNKIDIEIQIQEGAQATIDEISIKGNDRTTEAVIRRELRTRPGEKFSRAAIIRSQRALVNLGYFNPQTLSVKPDVNPQNGTVDIEYEVEERLSDRIEFSAGWNPNSGGLVGTLGLTLNNFSTRKLLNPSSWDPLPAGDGQTLSFRLQSSGRSYQSYNFSFSEPWMGGKKPNMLTVSGFYTNRFAIDEESDVNSKFKVFGGTIGLASRLSWPSDDFVSTTSLRFEKIKLSNWDSGEFILEDGSSLSDGSFHNLYLSQSIERNTINNPIFPTNGSRLRLAFQLTPPYSLFSKKDGTDQFKWLEYHKWRFDFDYYKQLKGKLVLRTSAKMGLIGRYNNDEILSPFERFRFGGDAFDVQQGYNGVDAITLRGYSESDFGANSNGGATIFNKFTAELRYPLSLNPSATVYLLAFAEAGNAGKTIQEFNPLNMKKSAGLGLRVHLPMFGTLGFDYGLGFDKDPTSTGNYFSKYGKLSIILGFEPD